MTVILRLDDPIEADKELPEEENNKVNLNEVKRKKDKKINLDLRGTKYKK